MKVYDLCAVVMVTDHQPTHLPYFDCEIYGTKPHRTLLYTGPGILEFQSFIASADNKSFNASL